MRIRKDQLEKSGAADATSNDDAKIAATTTELIHRSDQLKVVTQFVTRSKMFKRFIA